jgi:hypothetical protein
MAETSPNLSHWCRPMSLQHSVQKALGQDLKIYLAHTWHALFICPSPISTDFLASLVVISDAEYLNGIVSSALPA